MVLESAIVLKSWKNLMLPKFFGGVVLHADLDADEDTKLFVVLGL